MQYGYFDVDKKEYVITNPKTPTPWINYLGSGKYGGIISNTAGGYSFHTDPRNRRITRYRYNNVPIDRPGRYIYIKNKKNSEYWNPGFQPSQKSIKNYFCRHGLGYTVIEGEYKGVRAETVYFIPNNESFEIWLLILHNKTKHIQNLQIFSYAEFSFWDAIMDQQNVDWVQQINQGRYNNGIITWFPHHDKKNATFFATNEKINSFDTNLEAFIGKYHSEANPIAVENGKCSNSISYRMNGVGAFCIDLRLNANQKKEMIFILGYSENRSKIRSQIKKYFDFKKVYSALDRLKKSWNEYISKLYVETPDKNMNLFINTWNQYQCKITFNWSRSVSLYQLGLNRGMGFRDSSQDVLGVIHTIPYEAKKMIIKLLQCQYPEGNVYHLFFPLSGEGGMGDAPIKKFNWYSDDPLWIILAVIAYIKETGDFSFLKSKVFYNNKKDEGSIEEHLEKALTFVYGHRGVHKLALAGRADWNDALNLDTGKGVAESVFTSMLFCRAANEMMELYSFLKKTKKVRKYKNMYKFMKDAINKYAWDGSWYIRAYDDTQKKLGSNSVKYGKIFLNTQTWAVISGVSDKNRSKKCLDSVRKYLNTKYGIVIMSPAYPEFDETKGGITTYPKGAKENGGIFLHTNPWAMIAETILGNGDNAFRYYKQILPGQRNNDADLLEVEPYVYSQNILGKEHKQFGVGRNSWLSGTAAWNLVAASQYILGIRPGYDELIVEPCIPSTWDSFKVTRVFRGVVYKISIKNPNNVQKGVKDIIVDGVKREKIPLFPKNTEHNIEIIMG